MNPLGDRWAWVPDTQSYLHFGGAAVVWRGTDGKWIGHGKSEMARLLVAAAIVTLEREDQRARRKVASF